MNEPQNWFQIANEILGFVMRMALCFTMGWYWGEKLSNWRDRKEKDNG